MDLLGTSNRKLNAKLITIKYILLDLQGRPENLTGNI
jgi:hypothetical protein